MICRVVVIEEDPGVRKLLQKDLRQHGYEVVSGPDCESCSLRNVGNCDEQSETTCCDCLLWDTSGSLPAHLGCAQTPPDRGCQPSHVALMAACWGEEEQVKADELGCKTFTKPFLLADLHGWLSECQKQILPNRKLALLTSSDGTGEREA